MLSWSRLKGSGKVIAGSPLKEITPSKVRELDSYLNDHLAGSVAALELIAHYARLYKGKRLGAFFTEMATQIGTDQNTLRDLMRRLGIDESKVRQAGAWAGEKLGRALFAVAGNQPDGLGLLLALEGLIMGIAGKRLLWRALAAANLPEVEKIEFQKLQRRAEEQIKRAESERIGCALRALAGKTATREVRARSAEEAPISSKKRRSPCGRNKSKLSLRTTESERPD